MKAKKFFKIFLLDANMLSLNIHAQHLTNLGYADITTFNTAGECLNSLVQSPDIIFMDHNINLANGVDILKKIKRINPDIYVIFIAGIEDTEALVESLKNGAFEFIVREDRQFQTIDSVIQKVHRIKLLMEQNNIPSIKNMA